MKLVDSVKERVGARVAALRERSGTVDHAIRMQEHFGAVQGSQQAGGVTYFGFLSIFPVLALAFFFVGIVARFAPDSRDWLLTAIDQVLPGLVGSGSSQVSLTDVQDAAGRVGLIGLVGVLYAGLGWVSSLRTALAALFVVPQEEQPGFIPGKLRDLEALVVLGGTLLGSVVVSGAVVWVSGALADTLGLGAVSAVLIGVLGLALGLAAGAALFFLMFRVLARPDLPAAALWSGAILGAVAFEVLKQASNVLLAASRGQPAFQAFGTALILLVWINYFSRVVLYAAAWAHTDARSAGSTPTEEESEVVTEEVTP